MKKIIIILLVAFAIIVLVQDLWKVKQQHTITSPRPYVVLLSIDGFRWDYDTKTQTPTFDSITLNGVKAEGLQPCFPSKTFPNHYSIATGLYPGNHGLVSNSFNAKDINQTYSIDDRSKVEDGRFYLGEPIWVTAEAQHVKTASYFWVGSEAQIKGYRPTYWKKYEHRFPYEQRIDSVIGWLNKPYSERPHLVTWYIDRTDGVGHKYGPDSKQIVKSVAMLDSLMGVFMFKLNQLSIKDSVNFIIVSDHGMESIDSSRVVYLDKILKKEWVDTAFGGNPFAMIEPAKKCTDSIMTLLNCTPGIKAWKKEDLPERFHLKQSPRVSPVVVIADSSWSLTLIDDGYKYKGGTHGYDNLNRNMYGIFYAIGPQFKKGYNPGILYNIDIYDLLARILEIQPAPNDGQPERIMKVLKE